MLLVIVVFDGIISLGKIAKIPTKIRASSSSVSAIGDQYMYIASP